MRIGPSLILAGRQTLAMTPQLQQAIKLLQFSHLELAAYIQQELEALGFVVSEADPGFFILRRTGGGRGGAARRGWVTPSLPSATEQ